MFLTDKLAGDKSTIDKDELFMIRKILLKEERYIEDLMKIYEIQKEKYRKNV